MIAADSPNTAQSGPGPENTTFQGQVGGKSAEEYGAMPISDMIQPILEAALRHCERVVVSYRYPAGHHTGWRGQFEVEIWDYDDRMQVADALATALPDFLVGDCTERGEIKITPPVGPVQARREVAAAVCALAANLVQRFDGDRSQIAISTHCDAGGAGIEVSK